MTSLRQLQASHSKRKASKAFDKAAGRDSKSRACQSKQPAFCPYHGVTPPASRADVATRLEGVKTEILQCMRNGDWTGGLLLEHDKRMAVNELEAIDFMNSSSSDASGLSPNVEYAIGHRKEELGRYASDLADAIFVNPKEKFIAVKGSALDFALDTAESNGYPVASYMPAYTDGQLHNKSDEVLLREKTDLAKVTEFAKAHNMDVLTDRSGVFSYGIFPIDWDKYGMSRQDYAETSRGEGFAERLHGFRKSKHDVASGKAVSKFEPKV